MLKQFSYGQLYVIFFKNATRRFDDQIVHRLKQGMLLYNSDKTFLKDIAYEEDMQKLKLKFSTVID